MTWINNKKLAALQNGILFLKKTDKLVVTVGMHNVNNTETNATNRSYVLGSLMSADWGELFYTFWLQILQAFNIYQVVEAPRGHLPRQQIADWR